MGPGVRRWRDLDPDDVRGRVLRPEPTVIDCARTLPFDEALAVRGLDLRPQVAIDEDGWSGRPDLVDERRRLVVEADSFTFHGHRAALVRDCERYDALVLRGWTVLRFSWEHVVLDPDYVRGALERAVGQEARGSRCRIPA